MILTMIKTWTLVASIYYNELPKPIVYGITSKEECFRTASRFVNKIGIGIDNKFACIETYTPAYIIKE